MACDLSQPNVCTFARDPTNSAEPVNYEKNTMEPVHFMSRTFGSGSDRMGSTGSMEPMNFEKSAIESMNSDRGTHMTPVNIEKSDNT